MQRYRSSSSEEEGEDERGETEEDKARDDGARGRSSESESEGSDSEGPRVDRDQTDFYFEEQAAKKSGTSDHTLARLATSRMDETSVMEALSRLPPRHEKEQAALKNA